MKTILVLIPLFFSSLSDASTHKNYFYVIEKEKYNENLLFEDIQAQSEIFLNCRNPVMRQEACVLYLTVKDKFIFSAEYSRNGKKECNVYDIVDKSVSSKYICGLIGKTFGGR